MILVKKNILLALAIPISIKLFGPNKTWRGFIMVIIINSCFQWLLNNMMSLQDGMTAIGTGAALGFIYMLFELPNSWVKRQLGIQAGEKAKIHPYLFMLMDKMDSALGVTILTVLIFDLNLYKSVLFFFLAVAVHISFSMLAVMLGVKKRF